MDTEDRFSNKGMDASSFPSDNHGHWHEHPGRAQNRGHDHHHSLGHHSDPPETVEMVEENFDKDGRTLFLPNESYIAKAIKMVYDILLNRGEQYSKHGEFANFEFQALVGEMQKRNVFRGMIGQKLGRESSQHEKGYDTIDSILDTCGYSILWLAFSIMQKEYQDE